MRVTLGDPTPGASTRHRARVGYVDTDQAGVVHHTVYFVWLEQARVELMRARGVDYRAWEKETGLGLPVVEASLRWVAPARFDDEIEVETWVAHGSRAKLVFASRVRRGETLLCEGTITVACAHVAEARACSVPESLRRTLGVAS